MKDRWKTMVSNMVIDDIIDDQWGCCLMEDDAILMIYGRWDRWLVMVGLWWLKTRRSRVIILMVFGVGISEWWIWRQFKGGNAMIPWGLG